MRFLSHLVLGIALSVPAQNYGQNKQTTYIEVKGPRQALELLKAGGIPAKEVLQGNYVIPNVTIGGINNPVSPGDMVILTADYDQTKLSDSLNSIEFNWTVIDNGVVKKFFQADNGREIAFAVGLQPRTINVMLDVNCLFATKQTITYLGSDGKPVTKEFIADAKAVSPNPVLADIVVNPIPGPTPTPTPVPTPTPTPTPTPAPVLPNGKFGLAPFVYQTFMGITSIDVTTRKNLATKLAANFAGIASKIGAVPTYNDIAVILSDTKTQDDAIYASLNIDKTKISAVSAINAKINSLYRNGSINVASDLATAFQEMAQGFNAVQ